MPEQKFEIEYKWVGILGFHNDYRIRTPLVKKMSENIFVAARCSGMGVALTSKTGEMMCNLIFGNDKELLNEISPKL